MGPQFSYTRPASALTWPPWSCSLQLAAAVTLDGQDLTAVKVRAAGGLPSSWRGWPGHRQLLQCLVPPSGLEVAFRASSHCVCKSYSLPGFAEKVPPSSRRISALSTQFQRPTAKSKVWPGHTPEGDPRKPLTPGKQALVFLGMGTVTPVSASVDFPFPVSSFFYGHQLYSPP